MSLSYKSYQTFKTFRSSNIHQHKKPFAGTSQITMNFPKENHFVLVHGACLGAWVWYKVVTLLKQQGQKVTALDMAASGINPKSTEDVRSDADYSAPLLEFIGGLPPGERVVLLGHSLGGVCISLAMEKFPEKIGVAVFLAAVMPYPGVGMDKVVAENKRPADFFMDCTMQYGDGKDKPPTSVLFGPNYLSTKLCQLSPPEDVTLTSLVSRPTPTCAQGTFKEGNAVTKENYGSVIRVYLKSQQDNVINEPVEEFRLQNCHPDEVKIVSNADHMTMFSNPIELSAYLLEISEKYM